MFVLTRFRRAQTGNAIVISSETLKMMFWRQSNAEKTQGREHGCCSDALAFCAHELRLLGAGLRFFFFCTSCQEWYVTSGYWNEIHMFTDDGYGEQ